MFACIHSPVDLSLTEFAYGFSPIVEEIGKGTVVIDVEGCELLFGSPYQLASEIVQRAETAVSVAVAANPDAAIHAATHLKGITFVSPGEELTCLGDFPIEHLDYSLINVEKKVADQILETLRLWGVRTFADFAALPVTGVSERLGQEGIKLQQLAAGKTERHLQVKQPPPVFANSIELDHALTELEPLSFIFARLLHQLCAALNAYALATNELCVNLQLENQTTHERKLSLPHPMRDHKVFLKLLLLDAEMHPPAAAVKVSFNCLRAGETACVAERTVCAACAGAGQAGTDTRKTRKTRGRAKCRFARVARHTPAGCVQHETLHAPDKSQTATCNR